MQIESSNKDEVLEIPADHFVIRCDLDCEEPYCIILPKDKFLVKDEKIVPIPKALAYYLSTHSCGSIKMFNIILEQGKRFVRNTIRHALED